MSIGIGNPDVLHDPNAQNERGKCVTCAQWEPCLFHLKRNGAFKGTGIHNIGYRLITDPVEGSNGKADFCSCVHFIDSGMQDRMLTGRELQARGKRGELISICAQEGETITQGFQVGFNARNEIIKPIPNLVDPLRKAGYEVNLSDGGQAVEFKEVEFERVIPKYKAPNQASSDYSAKIRDAEAQSIADESIADDAAWEIARAKRAAITVKPKGKAGADDDGFEIEEGDAANA